MAYLDIGIDLGTTTVIANDSSRNVVVTEPALVAVDTRKDEVIALGSQVTNMVGRTPDYIQIIHPLQEGVISNYKMTEILIRHLIRQICKGQLVKPRLAICVPSSTTGVESQAVIDAAITAGARSVFLIEEPVAAAIGAGIDLSRPNGNLIVDIGGGTTDIAVLSLNGIVCKASLRVAGNNFDQAIIKHFRSQHNLLLGDQQAERIKIEVASLDPFKPPKEGLAKGRDLLSGLPKQLAITSKDISPSLRELLAELLIAVHDVLEKTPPELVGDIHTNGIILTGGGALLEGMDRLIEHITRVPTHVAENAKECVAIGTAKSFEYLGKLSDGFVMPSSYHS